MKHARRRDAIDYMEEYVEAVVSLIKQIWRESGGIPYVHSVLCYSFSQTKTADPDQMFNAIKGGLAEEGNIMATTVAEYLVEQGIQQGLQQGLQQGESTLLVRLLERKFKVIPENYRQKIKQASQDNLLNWGEKVLESDTLEEIFSSITEKNAC